ncbi:MAG: TetR/AcrR family transcriptional regulator [Deltaproteobacteria bacterium]|nr:TetR/AcrR family transcriptional regulator [Deltaproteobacteria bacterium]
MVEKRRDTTKKRTQILDAAATVFIEDGYERASMDRIAEMANASKRTVYNHFSSKEELFQAVLERVIDEAMELKQITYDSSKSLTSQLEKFADAKIAFTQKDDWLGMIKVTAGIFSSHPELVQKTIQQAEDNDTLAVWLQAATDDGRMKVENPRLVSTVFWSMIGGAFFWPVIFSGPFPKMDVIPLKKEMIKMFLERYSALNDR